MFTAGVLGLNLLVLILLVSFYIAVMRVSSRREVFTLHLRAGVRLGLPLHETMACWRDAPRDVARIMQRTHRRLLEGRTLFQAIGHGWSCLPSWYVNMLQVGEVHGNLSEVLDRILESDSRREEVRAGFAARLFYPFFLIVMLYPMLGYIAVYVMPSFLPMLKETGSILPGGTRVVLAVTNWLLVFGPVFFLFLAAVLLAIAPFPWGPAWDWWLRPLFELAYLIRRFVPPLRRTYVRAALGRWATMVSMLLDAGWTLPYAMREAARIEPDPWFARMAEGWAADVGNGRRLGDVLAESRPVPRAFVWQVRTAEGGGDFSRVLREVGEREVERLLQQYGVALHILLGVLVIGIGSVVGFFVVSTFSCLTELVYEGLNW